MVAAAVNSETTKRPMLVLSYMYSIACANYDENLQPAIISRGQERVAMHVTCLFKTEY